MENYWNNRDNRNYRDYPDRYDDRNNQYDRRREEERNRYANMPPQDPDTYRGAYRLDNSSDHRHVSTYYGFGDIRHPEERQHPMDEEQMSRRDSRNTHNALNQRWQNNNNDRNDRYNNDNRPHQDNYRQDLDEHRTQSWRDYMDHSDDWGRGNFYNDYGPDHYPHRRGENTGNMAGSLSFGYDGDHVSNPDFDRRYNPLTGEVRHEFDNRHRRNIGRNPSTYRLYDLHQDRRDY